MFRVIITTYHEVEDDVANELVEAMRSEGSMDPLLRFIQEHRPETIGSSIGGMKPPE